MPTAEELKSLLKKDEAELLMRKLMHEVFNQAEQMQYNMLMHKLDQKGIKHDALPTLEELEKVFPQKKYSLDADSNDYQKIMDDFAKQFPPENLDKENGVMTFNSKEDAISFFKAQSEKGRSFCVSCTSRDHTIFSDGKGHFVEGTKAEVVEYLKENNVSAPGIYQPPEEKQTPGLT